MTVQATSEDTLSSPMKVFLKAGKIKVVPWEFIPGFDDALELGKAAAENIAATAVELGVPAVAPAPEVVPVKQRKRGANIAKPTVPLPTTLYCSCIGSLFLPLPFHLFPPPPSATSCE